MEVLILSRSNVHFHLLFCVSIFLRSFKTHTQSDHPVVVAGKTSGKSKWTTFIEIHDSDDVSIFTTTTSVWPCSRLYGTNLPPPPPPLSLSLSL